MSAWSGEPFGNDEASDWAWELDDAEDWEVVRVVLLDALESDQPLDADVATLAIAGAETVAHGLGRGTQHDSYTEPVIAFTGRVGPPPAEVAQLAVGALAVATDPAGDLARLWEDDSAEWQSATSQLEAALRT